MGGARIDLGAFNRLIDLGDYYIPFTLRTMVQLGLAELLADGGLPVGELARRTGTDERSLYRALRALAGKGVFAERSDREFVLTPMAELLLPGHPLSLRDVFQHMPETVAAWQALDYSLITGEPAFDHVHGLSLWEYLAEHPDEGERFDRGMAAMTRAELLAISAAYPWGDLGTVVDVGGGNGAFLAGLLRRWRHLRGVLFDLPPVVAHAAEQLAAANVASRCEVVEGDFFDTVPAGGDAYVLKRIVYGWDDAGAEALLRCVAEAMAPESRLLVIEPLMRPGNDDDPGKILDLLMLVVDGGRARDGAELEALFGAVGLTCSRTIPTRGFPIVEARLAPFQAPKP